MGFNRFYSSESAKRKGHNINGQDSHKANNGKGNHEGKDGDNGGEDKGDEGDDGGEDEDSHGDNHCPSCCGPVRQAPMTHKKQTMIICKRRRR